MSRSKFLNLELRSFILQHAIRQEYLTGEILKFIFRILKNETKTFGNSGSNISFQNKIDLLYDLGEIEKTDYSHFRKLLEIRNQFIHNFQCISFRALEKEKKEYTKYLKDHFPNKEVDEEKQLLFSYIVLFKHCHRILCQIRKAYLNKFYIELEKYQSYELLHSKFDDWTTQSRIDLEETWKQYNLDNSNIKIDKIAFFIMTLNAFKNKFFAEIVFDNIENNLIYKVFNKEKIR